MNHTIDKFNESFKHFQTGFEELQNGMNVLSSGPASYYLQKMNGYAKALFDVYAPFKVGDIVRLTKTPDTDNGWRGASHFLKKGVTGIVRSVDYSGGFVADVEIHNQTWINSEGDEIPHERPYLYCFTEDYLELVES